MKIVLILITVFVVIIIFNFKKLKDNKLKKDLCKYVKAGNREGINKLIEKSVDINSQWYQAHGGFPLEIAIENNDKETVAFLIEKGADVNYASEEYPLVRAVKNNNKDIVRLLIENGANVNTFTKPLDYAKDNEIIAILKSHGAITGDEQKRIDANFVNAVSLHDLETVKQLIPHLSWQGVNIIPSNVYDNTYMIRDALKIVYIHNGEEDEQGNITPLLYAAFGCDLDMIKVLVETGADVNARSSSGLTALMYAVLKKSGEPSSNRIEEIIDYLVSKGAHVNDKSYDVYTLVAYTALMMATSAGNFDAVSALIKNGADVNAVASNGSTSLSIAKANMFIEIQRLLERNGAFH